MKKITCLFFATFFTLMASSTGFSQRNQGEINGSRNPEYEERRRQEMDLTRREENLRDLDKRRLPPIDKGLLRQTYLNKALKELNDSGDALLTAIKVPGKKGSKD